MRGPREPQATSTRISDFDLPVYTVLVPLYREAEMLPQLIDGINRLDYPRRRLDVKLLLEEDDDDTRDALMAHGSRRGSR